MKIIILFIILILTFVTLRMCPKIDTFQQILSSPKMVKVIKEGSNAIVEWYHDDTDVQDYVLLYVDVDKLASGVWVQNNITCKTKTCRLVIKNLNGVKYKIAVLSKVNDRLSDLKPDDIITFTQEKPYYGYSVRQGEEMTASGDNETPPYLAQNNNQGTSNMENNGENENVNTQPPEVSSEPPSSAPAPVVNPLLDCTGGYVKLTNISKKEELEDVEIKPECGELEDLSQYMRKPFYHGMLDRIF